MPSSTPHTMEPVAFLVPNWHCPECGAALFTDGNEVWCSRQGSAERPGCSFGLAKPITVQQHIDTLKQSQQQEKPHDLPR